MVTTDDSGSATAIRDALKRIRDVTTLFETNRDEYDGQVDTVVDALRRLVGQFGEIELNVSTNRIMHGDDEAARGFIHGSDDPVMGWGRYAESMRIGFFAEPRLPAADRPHDRPRALALEPRALAVVARRRGVGVGGQPRHRRRG